MYPLFNRNFGNFDAFRLDPGPRLAELARVALDADDSGWTEADGDKDVLAECAERTLIVHTIIK